MFQYYRVYISLLISFICYLVFYFANIHLLQHLNSASYGDIYSSIKILIIISSLSLAAKQAVMTRYKPQFERTHRQLHQLGLLSWLTMNIATSAILLALGVVLSYFLHAVASNEIFQSAFTEHQFTSYYFCPNTSILYDFR